MHSSEILQIVTESVATNVLTYTYSNKLKNHKYNNVTSANGEVQNKLKKHFLKASVLLFKDLDNFLENQRGCINSDIQLLIMTYSLSLIGYVKNKFNKNVYLEENKLKIIHA